MHWQGEFAFGDVWLAFRGASADNRAHSHAALQLVASTSTVTVADDAGHLFTGSAWAIRSGVRHALLPTASLMLVLLEPQSHLAARLLAQLDSNAPIAPLPQALVVLLTRPQRVRDLMLDLEGTVSAASPPIDPRLAQALKYLERQTSGDAVAAASAQCGLSASRLRALSQEHFGLPLSKLVLWKKVRMACLSLARGANLAEAAIDAGFADQAHLTRTMSAVMGLTPGEARSAAS